MAFPTIPTAASSRVLTANVAGAATARTFPSLTSLTKNSGDLLIAVITAYQTTATAGAAFSGWPAGWTEFIDTSSSTTMAIGAAYKWSTGTETGTFTITQAATITGDASMMLMSIPGAHATQAPVATAKADGTTAAADPAALTPSWGAAETLWIAIHGNGETAATGSWTGTGATAPTNYSGLVRSATTDNSVIGQTEIAAAFRQLNTASENTATFSATDVSNARNSALTIAVRPVPSTVPGAPTIGTAVGGNAQASVAFTPPASNGGATIDLYRVTSTPGSITATGASSPVTITGLTNGTAYTFTVAAHNSVGYSAESAASNSVTPAAPSPKTIAGEETDLDDPAGAPATRTLHKIVVRAKKLNSAHTATVRAQLFESATARSAVLETGNLTTSFADYTLSVADSDAAAISNYNNLRLDLTGYSSTGDAAQVQIADAWVEIPAPSATAGPITVSGAPATEDDSATTGTAANPFVVAGAVSTEDDSATVGTAINTATIAGAPATENDSGTVGTAIDTATIASGVAPEDDAATTGAAINTATIAGGASTENDSATVGTAGAAILVAGGVSTEDDAAPAGTALGTTIISGAASTEDDSATTGTAINTATILGGTSTEDDSAPAGSAALRILVAGAPATEDDTGLAGTAIDTATITGGIATEDDAATVGSSGARQVVSGGVGTEDDSAPAGSTSNLLIAVGNPATEDDAATTGSVIAVQTVAGGTATEDDSATTGTAGARTNVQGAPSTEDDAAQAGVALVAIITLGGTATENDSAVVGQVIVPSLTISGSPATESDVALAGQIAQIQRVIGGVATESDLATAGFGTFPIFARIDLPTTVVLDPQNAATALRATVTLVAVRRTETVATPEAYGSTNSLDSSRETSAQIDPAPTTISVRKTAADMVIDQYADDVSLDAQPQEMLIDA